MLNIFFCINFISCAMPIIVNDKHILILDSKCAMCMYELSYHDHNLFLSYFFTHFLFPHDIFQGRITCDFIGVMPSLRYILSSVPFYLFKFVIFLNTNACLYKLYKRFESCVFFLISKSSNDQTQIKGVKESIN